jgi:exodeoxyribonuclease VII large subunit
MDGYLEQGLGNSKPQIYTVSDITNGIKSLLENTFTNIWIKGEVTNYKHHTSGHRYFSLKDNRSVIQATLFKQYSKMVKFDIEDGLEVKVHGSISVYPPRGQYQINVDFIEPVGKGALQLAFEQLVKRLQSEGIFDKEKKPIPSIPKNIGVVTSETGAALQDILRVTKERNASLNIYIFPARVQGEMAAGEIASAIGLANEVDFLDVLIIGRGGGSVEDLWAFNEPEVAYAVFDSKLPVISAVGHEINYSISDMVADLYVSTPSAAATFVCKSLEEFDERVKSYESMVNQIVKSRIELYKEKLRTYSHENMTKSFQAYIRNLQNLVDDYHTQIDNGLDRNLYNKKSNLLSAVQKIEALNPLSVLKRGYSIVLKGDKVISSVDDVQSGDEINIKLKDGEVPAIIR